MRNDYIGASIDGDARAACNSRSNGCNGCGPRQPRTCACEGAAWQSQDCGTSHNEHGCGCEAGRQSRECDYGHHTRNDNGCGCNTNRQPCDCGCNGKNHEECWNGDRKPCPCGSRTPAMVYAQHHDLDSIYGCERALIRGTLFGCLDKPMCHERCGENPCITQCQADKFTIWELRLYLNTHPCDKKALALLRKLTEQMDDDCGCAFDPDCGRWSWTDGPWPWEYQRCCGKEA